MNQTDIKRRGRLLTKPSIRNHTPWIDDDLRAPFYLWMTYVWDAVGRFSTTIVVGSHFYVEIGASDNLRSTHTIVCANIPSIGNRLLPLIHSWYWLVYIWRCRWTRGCTLTVMDPPFIPIYGLCDIMQKIEWNNEPTNSYQLPYHIPNDF